MRNVQIPEDLFIDLVKLHCLQIDDDALAERVRSGLQTKFDKVINHQLYTQSKTAPDEAEREKARREYLDRIGMHPDWIWGGKGGSNA